MCLRPLHRVWGYRYFASLLGQSGQPLGSNVELSVQTDANIFGWLLKWAEKQQPALAPEIVLPVLISSQFLQV